MSWKVIGLLGAIIVWGVRFNSARGTGRNGASKTQHYCHHER